MYVTDMESEKENIYKMHYIDHGTCKNSKKKVGYTNT